MSTQASHDVVIVGAGHNGLVCAFYLARAGLKVKLVERRAVVGGAAVTEAFHPGFRNSVCSYVVSLLHPKVIAELELHRHGLEILERPGGDRATGARASPGALAPAGHGAECRRTIAPPGDKAQESADFGRPARRFPAIRAKISFCAATKVSHLSKTAAISPRHEQF